jgi:hypothetical protein
MKKNKKRNWLSKIRNDPESFKAVPEDLKSVEFCLTAVKNDSRAFPYVPDSLKTEAVCLAAVKDNGRALKFVPDSLKTEAMCLAALNKTLGSLKYVPENLKTKLRSKYTIRLTDDEIDIINVWAKDFCSRNVNKVMVINEIIQKGNKEFLIDRFSQSKLKNISCIVDPFYPSYPSCKISCIELSENNTKASMYYWLGPLFGVEGVSFFSKENNIWKKIDDKFLGISCFTMN